MQNVPWERFTHWLVLKTSLKILWKIMIISGPTLLRNRGTEKRLTVDILVFEIHLVDFTLLWFSTITL